MNPSTAPTHLREWSAPSFCLVPHECFYFSCFTIWSLTILSPLSLDSPFSTFTFAPQSSATFCTKRTGIRTRACLYLGVCPVFPSMLFTMVDFLIFLLALRVPARFPLSLWFALLLVASPLSIQSCFIPSSFSSCSVLCKPLGMLCLELLPTSFLPF